MTTTTTTTTMKTAMTTIINYNKLILKSVGNYIVTDRSDVKRSAQQLFKVTKNIMIILCKK